MLAELLWTPPLYNLHTHTPPPPKNTLRHTLITRMVAVRWTLCLRLERTVSVTRAVCCKAPIPEEEKEKKTKKQNKWQTQAASTVDCVSAATCSCRLAWLPLLMAFEEKQNKKRNVETSEFHWPTATAIFIHLQNETVTYRGIYYLCVCSHTHTHAQYIC